jgi:peptide-methionine (R)-S-oxide reductase
MKIMKRTKHGFFGAVAASFSGASAGALASFEIQHSDAHWRRRLTPEQFRVLRRGATEPPFASPLLNERRQGLFDCAGCGSPLFSSSAKYDSGTGWPSFFMPLDGAVAIGSDAPVGSPRNEVHCRRCGGHLGHVFDDGPNPTGLRYCMNGAALVFQQNDLS